MSGKGEDAYLYSALSQYGYSLLQPDEFSDPNVLLARLSQSEDPRLLEGFPVVLANALESHRDKVNLAEAELELPGKSARTRFRKLVWLSFNLFDVFGLGSLKATGYEQGSGQSRLRAGVKKGVMANRPLELDEQKLDLERIKKTFVQYYLQGREDRTAEDKAKLREEFRQEYFLSLFFAPRQRDLLRKKLRGEALTKTEREYFSRVVKKKLMALSDPDLQRMAIKVLQQT
jgi:hypothetical protein